MVKVSSDVYGRIGLVPEQRLRWLLGFGNLDLAALNGRKRARTALEARTFMLIQETDPGFKRSIHGQSFERCLRAHRPHL